MLDEITKSTAARQDEVARGALDVQREQLASLQEQRQAAAELSRQKRALGIIGMMQPGSAVDADTADVMRQGGFGSLISEAQTSTQRATPVGPADDPRSWIEPTTSRTFAGTPQQQALQRFIDDPNTTPEQRAFVEMIEQGRQRKASEFQRRAKASGVEDLWDATYPRAHYATTRPGTPVVAVLFGIVEGSNASRDFAAALGITDPWDFNQHFIDTTRIDFSRLRSVLSGFAGGEDYLHDAARMETLARNGFVFYFLPNG